MKNVQKLINNLRELIEDYLENKSLRRLEAESGVPRHFLRKILNDDGKHSDEKRLDLTRALVLLQYLTGKTLLEIKDTDTTGIESYSAPIFEKQVGSSKGVAVNEELISDFTSFVIICLSSFRKVTRQDYVKMLGQRASGRIDNLVKAGFLREDPPYLYATLKEDERLVPSGDAIFRHVPQLIRQFYNVESYGNRKSYLGYSINCVNQQGLEQLYRAMARFHVQMVEICENPNYEGNIPVFWTLCMDKLLEEMPQ